MDKKLLELVTAEFRKVIACQQQLLSENAGDLPKQMLFEGRDYILTSHWYDILESMGCAEKLLTQWDGQKAVCGTFLELFYIHFSYPSNHPQPTSIGEMNSLSNKPPFSSQEGKAFFNMVMIYWCSAMHLSWANLARSADLNDAKQINMLCGSLPFLEVKIEDILALLAILSTHQSQNATSGNGVRQLVNYLTTDPAGSLLLRGKIDLLFSHPGLLRFFPQLFPQVCGEDPKVYDACFDQTKAAVDNKNAASLLYGLFNGVKIQPLKLNPCIQLLESCRQQNTISSQEYISICASNQLTDEKRIEVISEMLSPGASVEIMVAACWYLEHNIALKIGQWFEYMATIIFCRDDAALIDPLNGLLYQLEDLDLSYRLLTARFEKLGQSSFLYEGLSELAQQDNTLFQVQLTEWFLIENPLVHVALLKYSTSEGPSKQLFKLSAKHLAQCSSSDKLYIAIKVAGYMYSKDHLQELSLNLIESVKEEETVLLDALSDLMKAYVVYNYRTTLDLIKDRMREPATPAHLRTFYDDILKSYDEYFEGLSSLGEYAELTTDEQLDRYINFYEQVRMDNVSKKAKGLSRFFKNVSVHTKKWA
ncbi:hypothetical protein [Pedobacter frigidisoli]|uniref:hypothetical protein n=1 Tax=Pedobacter frigidisoli TaxID=2530455 RepID=UPI002930C8C4|nr:hypothetical protein [Pedobacter frigidisoli]